jgi:hypothetical protein
MFERAREWWRRWREGVRRRLVAESEVVVTADDGEVTARYPDGEIQRVGWNDVARVSIETDGIGPWGADVWWVLEGEGERCTYPQGATGEHEAMGVYDQKLPGFDWRAVRDASMSFPKARFVCWEKHQAD